MVWECEWNECQDGLRTIEVSRLCQILRVACGCKAGIEGWGLISIKISNTIPSENQQRKYKLGCRVWGICDIG